MPSRWMLGQAGLPFDKAWLYMSELDVATIEPERRARLEAEGTLVLVKIDNAPMGRGRFGGGGRGRGGGSGVDD